jgi:hypothetical protein
MAGTRIIMSDDVSLIVGRKLDDVQQSFYDAMGNGGWVRIHPDDGPAVSINPRRVLYMEEVNLAEAALRNGNGNGNGKAEKSRRPSPAH